MSDQTIAIIGGGNLGRAIAEGLLESGFVQPSNLTITRRKTNLLADLADKGANVTSDNLEAVKGAAQVILAVKPYKIESIVKEIAPALDADAQTLVSVVTGVSIAEIGEALGFDMPVVRAMPNTAIAIRESMTCVAGNDATQDQLDNVAAIFNQLGKAIVIDEELMEAATVLGACGVAYALRFVRAASQGGIEIGFDSATAQLIAAQTVKGAASLLERGLHPEAEIDKVTTPQGCTIAGLNEMEHQGFSSALIKGVLTSYKKIT